MPRSSWDVSGPLPCVAEYYAKARHGTDDVGFWPVGFANNTAILAKTDSARMIQKRAGIVPKTGRHQ